MMSVKLYKYMTCALISLTSSFVDSMNSDDQFINQNEIPSISLQEFNFSIDKVTLDEAIVKISRITGVPILLNNTSYYSQAVEGIYGQFNIFEALDIILTDTTLRYIFHGDSIVIKNVDMPEIDITTSKDKKISEQPVEEPEVIIITNTAGSRINHMSSSVAVTNLSSLDIELEGRKSFASMLTVSPGFFSEDSGGEVSNNLSLRGLNGGQGFSFIGILENGLPILYGSELVDSIARIDNTIDNIQVVRGGAGAVRLPNSAAATINLITKKGTPESTGSFEISYGNNNYRRTDVFIGFPINESWSLGFGGYYRQSNGARDPGFLGDRGGAARLTFSRETDTSNLNFYFRHINEKNIFYTPIPIQDTSNPRSLPGLNALSSTLISQNNSLVSILTPKGAVMLDLKDGVETKYSSFGFDYSFEFGQGWKFKEAFRISRWKNDFKSVFSGGTNDLKLASERLLESDSQNLFNIFPRAYSVGYRNLTTGQIIPYSSLEQLNNNGLVAELIWLNTKKNENLLVNDFTFTHESKFNAFSIGFLYYDGKKTPFAFLSRFLSDVNSRPNMLDLVALDENDNIVGQLTDNGFLTYISEYSNGRTNMSSSSFYLQNEYLISNNLRIDLGYRIETLRTQYSGELTQFNVPINSALTEQGTDNDNIIANNEVGEFGTGIFQNGGRTLTESSWTVGFNHIINSSTAFYGRLTNGVEMPPVGREIENISNGNIISNPYEGIERGQFKFWELGIRHRSKDLEINTTGFMTSAKSLFSDSQEDSNGDIKNQLVFSTTDAIGIEFASFWSPNKYFSVDVTGVIQKSSSKNKQDLPNVIEVQRQSIRIPNYQLRLKPTFYLENMEGFLSYQIFGERFNDLDNTVKLAPFSTIDLGFSFRYKDDLTFQFHCFNIFNTIGLTEGNARDNIEKGIVQNITYARPIFERRVSISAKWEF